MIEVPGKLHQIIGDLKDNARRRPPDGKLFTERIGREIVVDSERTIRYASVQTARVPNFLFGTRIQFRLDSSGETTIFNLRPVKRDTGLEVATRTERRDGSIENEVYALGAARLVPEEEMTTEPWYSARQAGNLRVVTETGPLDQREAAILEHLQTLQRHFSS